MKQAGILLALFGILIVVFPDFLAYLIGGFFIFLGVSFFLGGTAFGMKKGNKKDYVKFGEYKIFR